MDELHKDALGNNFGYARENRQTQTGAEELLWKRLRNRGLKGHKFRRQHPISSFIADFYCHELRLVIEVDGSYHHQEDQNEYDLGRTFEINELGIKVIRFTNQDVEKNMARVLNFIIGCLGKK